jgi:hypothetical protein
VISFAILSTCLDFAAEDRRVTERNAALEKMSVGVAILWSDPRCQSAIVLLQDRAQHIGDVVDIPNEYTSDVASYRQTRVAHGGGMADSQLGGLVAGGMAD